MMLSRSDIAAILAAIPAFDQKALSTQELLPRTVPKAQRAKIASHLDGFLHSLEMFNVISLTRSGKVKATSEIATYFLRSLSRYVKMKFFLVSSWERPAIDEQFSIHTMMNWGSNFLYLLEHRRVNQFGDKEPIRFVDVVQLVVKAKVAGTKNPMYLMQYDIKAHLFQFVGGKRLPSDKSDAATVARILDKELPLNNLIPGKIYSLVQVVKGMIRQTLSPTYGAYSQYRFDTYHLKLTLPNLKLGPLDRWVSEEEIAAKVTFDGVPIADTKYDLLDLQQLGLSLEAEQPAHLTVFQHRPSKIPRLDDTEVKRIIAGGETETLEFKSSLRYDYNEKTINKALEKPVIKTIAAFLNCDGGTLLIGVNDAGEVLGLQPDFESLTHPNSDGFSQTLFNSLTNAIGIEFSSFMQIRFSTVEKRAVCIVDVRASPEPVFIRDGTNREFYVRAGTTTRLLNSEETFKYVAIHW